ncbi:hypothetical protein G6F57_021020 [Rhizopus arrhizus]|nr:hypothetical protein G6F22_014193 [Rhizopus arrhizus]KAG1166262.1 hypothetical protein G6F35_018294 [Rhizopus arrhizus]KAG1435664.1 hypothetical protein G6F57_021020 [Rhizopus arrhizus]
MRQAAAQRPAVADGAVGDARGHLLQGRAAQQLVHAVLDLGVRHGRAHAQHAVLPGDGTQFRQAGNVDDDRRTRQPQVQHRPKRLAAGHQLGAAVVFAQRPQGFL